ncbi:chondroadherin-like protein [Phyllobates terribilis]|uniref:chondroadherin-like protein n=1 Tax=Phyllobates terribilis TaxID=111132 RepID=UPI003CCAE7FB
MKMLFLHCFLALSLTSVVFSDPCPQVCICDNIKTFVTCAKKNLTEIPADIPQYTQKLILQRNQLKVIPSVAFLSTPYLTHLSLQNCSIERIEEGSFRGLGRLRYLNLGYNRISFIQQESFDGLSSLEQLILEKNRIEEIKPGAFSQLGFLSVLNLEDNFLVYLPDMVFQGLLQLKWMSLSKNMISIVSLETFAALPNLKRLSLDHNELQYLPTEAFSRLSGLTRLELGWNPMTFIVEEAIQMASLKQLLLNNMALQDVSYKAFEKSKQLSFIDMSNNQIRSIQPLSGVEQLKRLDLTGNTIICDCFLRPFKEWADLLRLKVDLFCAGPTHFLADHLDSLRAIDLKCGNFPEDIYKISVVTEKPDDKNPCPQSCDCKTDAKHAICENKSLQKIPRGFHMDTTLIDLRKNSFHSIPKGSFLDLKNVASLHLQNCEINDIQPGAFMGMINLVYVYLSHNKISSLKPEVFQGATKIGYLFLDHNRFTNFPKETFRLLPNLFSLHMQQNSIDSLSNNNLFGTQKLRWLYLTGNKINSIAPTAFRNLKDLEQLYLDDNALSEVPTQALKGMPKLTEFRLSKNPIKNIGNGAFLPVSQSLQHLYLNDMRLQQLSSGAFAGLGKNIKSLFLENNNLQNLPNMKNFKDLEVINLANNPFNCDCRLLHLHRWISSLNLKVGATCAAPKSLRGQKVRNAKFASCPGLEDNKERRKRKISAISTSKKNKPRK